MLKRKMWGELPPGINGAGDTFLGIFLYVG